MIQRRQVSTRPEKVETFLQELSQAAEPLGGLIAIVEVCGFNDWLIAMLREYECREIVLIHPDKRAKHKTDRRDASALSELLWLNRERLAAGWRGVSGSVAPFNRTVAKGTAAVCQRKRGQSLPPPRV